MKETHMTERSARHASFAIERIYDASPARVFAAWATPEAKLRWFSCNDDWRASGHELDFRVGGRERLNSQPPEGPVHSFEARFLDIVPDARIVYAYDMRLGETRISVSLTTVELAPAGAGTRLAFTEQVVFLDGYDDPGAREREEGTRAGLDNLDRELRRQGAPA